MTLINAQVEVLSKSAPPVQVQQQGLHNKACTQASISPYLVSAM